jgi:uncharacterized protein (TIGR02118 family)
MTRTGCHLQNVARPDKPTIRPRVASKYSFCAIGMCHIFCDSIEAFQTGFGPHAQEIMADIPNYTDQAPVIQISEVVVG